MDKGDAFSAEDSVVKKNNKKTTRIHVGLIIKTVTFVTFFVGMALVLASIKPLIFGGLIAGMVYAIKRS